MAFSIGDFFALRGSRKSGWLKGLARRDKTARGTRMAAPARRVTFEALEPRLLLSADALVGGSASALIDGLSALGDEIEQVVFVDDPGTAELFDAYVPGVLARFGNNTDNFESSPTLREALGIWVNTKVDPLNAAAWATASAFIASDPSLAARHEFIETNGSAALGESDAGQDEIALRVMDLNSDAQVSWEEAFQVMVVGQFDRFLAGDLGSGDAEVLGNAIETFFTIGLDVPGYLTDRVGVSVGLASASVSDSDTLTVTLSDLSLTLIQSDRFDLGQQGDELGIVVDPPAIDLIDFPDGFPEFPTDPLRMPLARSISFDTLAFGLRGVADGVADADFFFSVPADSMHAGVTSVDISNLTLQKNGIPTVGFGLNVGFLGASADADVDNDGNTDVNLLMTTAGGAVDPSNPDAIGFLLSQQGDAAIGSVTAGGAIEPTTLNATPIEFSIKLGTNAGGEAVEIDLNGVGLGWDEAADLVGPLQDALDAAGLQLLTVSDDSGFLRIAVASHNPAPIGFAGLVGDAPAASLVGAAATALLGRTAADLDAVPDASFVLISTDNATGRTVARWVQVNVTSFSGAGADTVGGTDDDVTEIADLKTAVEGGLGFANFAGPEISVTPVGGNSLTLSQAGHKLQISRSITLDTIDQITPAELAGAAEVLALAKDAASAYQVELDITARAGLTGDDGDGDPGGSFRPTGTIKVDLDDPFTEVTGRIVDLAPDGAAIVKASYALTDGADVALTEPVNDMRQLLDFNVIGPADMLAIVSQLANYLERLAASDMLQAADLPFVDATLGDLLQFRDFIADSLLIDDFDDGPTKDGANKDGARLLQWVGDDLTVGFGTAQDFEVRLAQTFARLQLGILGPVVLDAIWDDAVDAHLAAIDGRVATTEFKDEDAPTLLYNLAFSNSLLLQTNPADGDSATVLAPLDFDVGLAPLANFETDSKVRIGADGTLGATLGIVLGNAVPVLANATPVAELNGDTGVTVNTNLAYTSNGVVTPLVGRLTSNATFTVRVFEGLAFTDHAVSLSKASTATNLTLADLRADLAAALVAAGLPATRIAVFAEDNDNPNATGRLFLRAVDGAITSFQIVAANSAAVNQLGFVLQSSATVSVVAPANFVSPSLGGVGLGTLALDVAINGDPAVTVSVGGYLPNVANIDLVNDVNAALAAAGIGNRIVASDGGGRLVFSAIDPTVFYFSINPDNDDEALAVGAGLDTVPDSGSAPPLLAGVALRGSAPPIDPFGRLADTINFTVSLNGAAGVAVQITQDSTAQNQSIADLAIKLSAALETALPGKVAAFADNGRLAIRAIDPSVTGIVLGGLDDDLVNVVNQATGATLYQTTYLGLTNPEPDDAPANAVLSIGSTRLAPVSFGVATDTSFDVKVDFTGGPITKTISLSAASSVYNRSTYDLAAQINNALNAQFGGDANPLVANLQGGRVVIGLKTGPGVNLIGDATPVSADVTGFQILNVVAGSAADTDLKLVNATADHADFVIALRKDNGAGAPELARITLPGNSDQKVTGDLGPLLQSIRDQVAAQTSYVNTTQFDIEFGGDGTSLRLVDKVGGPHLLRVIAVNGSPAALGLGLLGSDTSSLNVNEQGVASALVADGVVDGGRIATIDIVDRAYFEGLSFTADLELRTDAAPLVTATYGLVGVELSKSADAKLYDAHVVLPFKAQAFTLDELLRDLGSIDLLQQDFNGLPSLTSSNTIDFRVAVSPAVVDFVNNSIFDLDAGAKVTFDFNDDSLGRLRYAVADGADAGNELDLTDTQPASGVLDLRYQAPGITVTDSDLGTLDVFDKLDFDDLLAGLQGIANALNAFDALPFLAAPLPVLGISINDLLSVGARFQQAVDGLTEDPGATIQSLSQKLREAFALPVFADDVARDAFFANLGIAIPSSLVTFSLGGGRLWVDLRLPIGFSKALSLDLDLGDVEFADDELLEDIALKGGAGLKTGGYLDVRMKFGVDLAAPADVVVDDSVSGVDGKLFAGADNLAFNAAIGPLGVFVKDGSAEVDFRFTYKGNDADGNHESLVDFAGQLTPELQAGSLDVVLPIYAPTDSEFIDDLTFNLSGITLDGTGAFVLPAPTVFVPDFTLIDLADVNPFNSIPLMLDGLDFFLQTLQDTLTGEVFSIELPFIGDDLRSAANFIEDMRRDVLAPIRQYVEQAPQLGEELVQALLYSILGPGSADVTVGGTDLSELLGLGGDFAGIGLLLDSDGIGAADDVGDVTVTSIDTDDNDEDDDFLWQFQVGDSFTPSYDLKFDLGIPALSLEGDIALDIVLAWKLAIGFGVNLDDGAYLDTSSDAELTVDLAVAVGDGSMVRGTLGFLQVEITESSDAGDGLEGASSPYLPLGTSTFLEGLIKVDFQDGTPDADDKVSFSDLGSLNVVLDIALDAEVNLDLIARIDPAIVPDVVAALLPELHARFVLDWEYSPTTSLAFTDSLSLLGFRDVELDIGSFFTDFVGPFIDKIAEVTEPLQPIIDVITAPIPVLSDLAGSPVTLIDLAGTFGYVEPAMIYAIADIITLANTLANTAAGGMVNLGDFMLIDDDSPTPVLGATDKGGLLSGNFFQSDARFAAGEGGLASTLNASTGNIYDQAYFDNANSGNTAAGGLLDDARDSGFDFPILSNPASLLGLLVGQDVALVTYDLAPFGMDFSYVQKFPIWGPLFARIGGSVGLTIDLAFGYDTRGVREFAEGGFSNPLDLLAGLYVSDTDLPIGTGGTDVPELILEGELLAGAEINLGVGSAGVEGAIILTVNFDLYDPDHDGRVRIDELVGNFLYEFNYGEPALAPIAIFDVYGDVSAELRAFVELLFFEQKWTITPPITLVEFSIDFDREPFLATEKPDGSLLLNIGPNAAQRLNSNTDDIDETIFVRSLSDTEVEVWGMGINESDAQSYRINAAKGIVGYAGQGNDKVDLSEVAHGIVYVLDGGVGDDTLHASQGGGKLLGNDGNDKLFGGDAADEVYGGTGADEIHGGKARDIIFGDSGFVSNFGGAPTYRSFVGAKDGGDTIFGDAGEDLIFGGGGIDTIRGGDDADLIIGDGGNFSLQGGALLADQLKRLPALQGGRLDIYTRGPGAKDIVLGEGGGDFLLGGTGDDIADGGADNDEIEGGIGFDTLYGGSGADTMYGGDQDDLMFGERDPYPQLGFKGDEVDAADAATDDGADLMFGEDGNDFMRGQAAIDTMDGGRGADIMFGDAGNDVMRGEAGGDIMFGGADSDTINAGDGSDIVFGDEGLVLYATFGAVANDADVADFGSRIRNDGLARYIGDGDETVLLPIHTLDSVASSIDLIVAAPTAGDGSDFIAGGDGKDIVFGGGSEGGVGYDTIFGDYDPSALLLGPRPSGQDILIGDGGRVELVGRRNARAAAESNTLDGVDHMSGNDSGDYMFGGGASDLMHGFDSSANEPLAGVSDNDVMLGDNGEILFAEGEVKNRIEIVRTTVTPDPDDDSGRSDVMFGTWGNDVMLGGLNGSQDIIEGGIGQDVLLGDQGALYFVDDPLTVEDEGDDDPDTLDLIRSFRDGLGGSDVVSGGEDADVLIGGTDGDEMYGDDATASHAAADGEDIMLGDNADVVLIGSTGRLTVKVAAMPEGTAVDLITTTDENDDFGGADTMSGNAGADIVFGGINDGGADLLYGDQAVPTAASIDDDANDILVGDNGRLDFTFDLDDDRETLDLIRSYEDGLGGTDILSGNKGADVGIGGTGADEIYGDDDDASAAGADTTDILLGDNADVFLMAIGGASGPDLRTVLDAAVMTIRTTDEENPDYGGVDTISGNADDDIIAGGVEGDTLYGDAFVTVASLDGDDLMLGDNGALEWLSDGDLDEVLGIDIAANNPALAAWFSDGDDPGTDPDADTDLGTLDLITTEQPTSGGRDLMYGDEGSDRMFGGTDLDRMYGDDGDETAASVQLNRDLMFGDHGRLYPLFSLVQVVVQDVATLVPSPAFTSRNYFAIDTGNGHGGQGDLMRGEEGDDVMLGQQGDDRLWGGSGNDDMIGGHNVAGGIDELSEPSPAMHIDAQLGDGPINPAPDAMSDAMDGGSGNDAMAGDNAIIWRRGDDLSPRYRWLTASTIYSATETTIVLNVDTAVAAMRSDPDDAVGRDTQLLDHADDTVAGLFGQDVMAGGAGDDAMFGQLGDDLMQGDGEISTLPYAGGGPIEVERTIEFTDAGGPPDTTGELFFNVPEQPSTDGDDYMEGNGGRDLMYGGLGQDDMIGGSSNLFGLGLETMRPDDSDTMFGGAYIDYGRNDEGDAVVNTTPKTDGSKDYIETTAEGHALDADLMMGDNANVFRLVVGGAFYDAGSAYPVPDGPALVADSYLTFLYDNYGGTLKIVPRGMQHLDYTLGGADYNGGIYVNEAADVDGVGDGVPDNGAADLIHGESGDDIIFGMTGSDVLFGDGQDDDVIGGYGHDWISGGTGQDGVLGDDGLIFTSRNSTLDEPLYGVAGLLSSDPDSKYSNGTVLDEKISTPGSLQTATINVGGELKKAIDLVPFSYDNGWIGIDDEFADDASDTPFADDVIFGGLGSDWLHGGSGDDAISGAEALEQAYVPAWDKLDDGDPDNNLYDLGYSAVGVDSALVVNPTNRSPGDVLAFNPEDEDGQHLNNRFRAGEFRLYDEYNPRRKIELTAAGELATDGNGAEYLLNFNADEGVYRPAGNVPKATGQQTESYPAVRDDGADVIFGDLGNDWIVGGTGRDNAYGGWGNDLLQVDDKHDTNGELNDIPDTHPTYEDRAYGGAGRDVLIGNTGGDRLIDWVGEYNSYLVPFAPFGQAAVSRTLQPFLPEFLYALSAADGADPTRKANAGDLRNGEPRGELGLVLQKDTAWQDQTGAPADLQAGNIPGGKRDVLRSADFTGNTTQGFVPESGTWKVANNAYEVAPAASGSKDAISLFNSDVTVPSYFEITATINAIKPVAGFKANAYIIFDYQSPADFKFAGINISTNKIEIGQRASWGFQVLASKNMLLKAGQDYGVLIAINGSAVTLVVNGVQSVSHAFAPRTDADGFKYNINAGMYGLGADNAKARIDNVVVQQIPPKITLTLSDAFDGTSPSLVTGAVGAWTTAAGRMVATPGASGYALAVNPINASTSSMVKVDAVLSTAARAGLVFDVYSATDFKWAAIDKASNQVLLGHYTAKAGWVTDAAVARTIGSGDQTLSVTLKGTTVSLTLNGAAVLSKVYNAPVVDGAVGVFSHGGSASFDSFAIQSDDSKFAAPTEQAMQVTSTTSSDTRTAQRLAVATSSSNAAPLSSAPVIAVAERGAELVATHERGRSLQATAAAQDGRWQARLERSPVSLTAAAPRDGGAVGSPLAAASAAQSAPLAVAVADARSGADQYDSTRVSIDWDTTVPLRGRMEYTKSALWLDAFVNNMGQRRLDPNRHWTVMI